MGINSSKNSRFLRDNNLAASKISNHNSQDRSHSNSPSSSNPIVNIIPEKKLKIKGKVFAINGK